jgi:hypothetical protein
MFFTSKIILTQHSHGTAAAVNHTAAPPHLASPAGIDELRDAGNAEGTAKKVSNMIEIHHFVTSKMFSPHTLTRSLLLPTRQQLHPPASRPTFAIDLKLQITQK